MDRALPTIREELEVSYPFHFSTKHLIETFNDNPGFQKTRDVIRLMASIVRAIWGKGPHEVERHSLLTLAGKALQQLGLASRLSVHGFLSKLPAGTTVVGARAKVVKAESDNRIAIAWDGKTKLTADRLMKAYEYLDGELADAEWELDGSSIIFPTGASLIDWQKELSVKIAPGLITQ